MFRIIALALAFVLSVGSQSAFAGAVEKVVKHPFAAFSALVVANGVYQVCKEQGGCKIKRRNSNDLGQESAVPGYEDHQEDLSIPEQERLEETTRKLPGKNSVPEERQDNDGYQHHSVDSRTPSKTADTPSINDQMLERNAKKLGRRLQDQGEFPQVGDAAHHIVPAGATNSQAVASRKILEQHGIDIDSAENGVWLPHNKAPRDERNHHSDTYGSEYSRQVYNQLRQAESREDVLVILDDIKRTLKSGGYAK